MEQQQLFGTAPFEKGANEYLRKKGVTLWANWEIQREERRKEAAAWLTWQAMSVLDNMPWRDLVFVVSASRWRWLTTKWKAWRNKRKG